MPTHYDDDNSDGNDKMMIIVVIVMMIFATGRKSQCSIHSNGCMIIGDDSSSGSTCVVYVPASDAFLSYM